MSPFSAELNDVLEAGCGEEEDERPPVIVTMEDRRALLDELDRFASLPQGRRIRVVHVLGRVAESESMDRLRALLPSMAATERLSAAIAFARIGGPGAFAALRQMKDDASVDVRRMVVNALGRIKMAEARSLLEDMRQHDAASLVRKHAARMLNFQSNA